MTYLPGIAMALMALASTANAATVFASGKIYGSSGQTQAVCYLFNASSKPITIISAAINDESGTNQANTTTCHPDSTQLAAGAGCLIAASSISQSSAFDCFITASSGAGLRGSLEIRQFSAVLQSQYLR
jgi:hypothetical protein